ncbi:MAG: hypothetical protein KGH63_00005, partial [Candidatus Micrarchaeota archaeon]|nr:hypothetical protein [Candidatus Micrarchaeota archaeon]
VSFSNVSWPFFQPWMLALQDGFDWKATRLFTVQPVNESSATQVEFKVLNRTSYAGRDAYLVELTDRPAPNQTAMGLAMAGAAPNADGAAVGAQTPGSSGAGAGANGAANGADAGGGASASTEAGAAGADKIDMLIDAQERVLLYTSSGPVTVRLVGAPFLNSTAAN